MKRIKDILGKREVYTVPPDHTVQQVVEYLCERGVGAVAICNGPDVIGVFSERDLMRRVVRKGLDPATTPVTDVMTTDVIHVGVDDTTAAAMSLMIGKNFRHLAVLDEDRRLRGFVSIRELMELDLQESHELINKLNDDYYEERFRPES